MRSAALPTTRDVLIENFRPGSMERMGLGYDRLRSGNPGLIYCQVTGYGRTGPLADRGGFDLIAQGYSGLMSITGEGEGRPPVKVGGPVTDVTAGILAALGVVSALLERARTGRGQRVDTSLFEAGIVHTYWQSAIALAGIASPGALGSAHPLAAPYQAFETADGWINVGASSEATWERFTRAIGSPSLALDARFRTNPDRMNNLVALVAILEPILRTRTSGDWLKILDREGVPAGPVASIQDMLAHPQTAACEMVVETAHPTVGRVRSLGPPIKLSRTAGAGPDARESGRRAPRRRGPTRAEPDARESGPGIPVKAVDQRPAPRLGEHTREVLAMVGLTEAEIERMIQEGSAAEPRDE